jgi:hypothetical protein
MNTFGKTGMVSATLLTACAATAEPAAAAAPSANPARRPQTARSVEADMTDNMPLEPGETSV